MKLRFQIAKRIIELACALLYSIFLTLFRRKSLRIVIFYHSLKSSEKEKFEKQMAFLAQRCHTVKVSEIMTAPANGSKVVVGVTFDDAFMSFREYALPVLKKYGLSAAIFVPTGNLGKRPAWALEEGCQDADEIVMNEQQIIELDKAGIEIFSHTVSHPVLTEIKDSQLHAELVQSKEALESIVGHEVIGISYPHGAFNSQVCKVAKHVGYLIGFSIEQYLAISER